MLSFTVHQAHILFVLPVPMPFKAPRAWESKAQTFACSRADSALTGFGRFPGQTEGASSTCSSWAQESSRHRRRDWLRFPRMVNGASKTSGLVGAVNTWVAYLLIGCFRSIFTRGIGHCFQTSRQKRTEGHLLCVSKQEGHLPVFVFFSTHEGS